MHHPSPPGARIGWLRRAARDPAVALETTLLAHGLPRDRAALLHDDLDSIAAEHGASAALVGVLRGKAIVGMDRADLAELLAQPDLPKLNTANLGLAISSRSSGATTVSATMELAAAAGLRVFATGGIGGVHRGYAEMLDVSSDLTALARFPVAVVSSGVKGLLDVRATRELLESLGVPVIGFATDRFPAFYQRDGGAGVDARFDDLRELADFLRFELTRTRRGVLVCNPIPESHEIQAPVWERWLQEAEARARAESAIGRDVTPRVLGALHEVSGGATIEANLALVRANVRLGAALATALARTPH